MAFTWSVYVMEMFGTLSVFSYFNQPVHFEFVIKLLSFGKECSLCIPLVRSVIIGIYFCKPNRSMCVQSACMCFGSGQNTTERMRQGGAKGI